MGEINKYILVGKSESMRPFGRPRHIRKDSIKKGP
jgi:hypothetical protein